MPCIPSMRCTPTTRYPTAPQRSRSTATSTTHTSGRVLQNLAPAFTSEMQSEEDSRVPQRLYGASRPLVDEAKKQLALLFGVPEIPEPTSYRLWDGSDDFEFAYHQWRLGVDDREIRTYLSQPLPNIHFCNEAISDMHGWVNGSLRSADLALTHFDIEPLPAPTASEAPSSNAAGYRVTYPAVSGVWGG
ncbi:hypothetical protein GQR58_030346 [Nymphon striatum]|nr:hypothetical protein GQR58_030346 [Nymphon striatum]